MTAEQHKKVEEIYDSLPDALGPVGANYKYISKEVLVSIVNSMVTLAVYEAQLQSIDEFKTIVDETFN
jgi:hypothetical protein